jgi:NAD(P)-dependent dehydrogenase (short-subunit alcohol dehydrogenase family)
VGRVEGKVAVVTGAASGIGAETATLLASEGASVVATDIDVAGVEAVVAAITTRGDIATAIPQDVTDEARWREVFEAAAGGYGGLNILVNNAGIGHMGPITEVTLEEWRHVQAVDVESVFLGCKHAIGLMEASGGGSIINISSVAGIIASPELPAYNAAKAAVRHLSKSVALYCAKIGSGIRCNSIHPGWIDTPILDPLVGDNDRDLFAKHLSKGIPLGHLGRPIDIAYGVLYLASDESAFVTGSELVIDGGMTAI